MANDVIHEALKETASDVIREVLVGALEQRAAEYDDWLRTSRQADEQSLRALAEMERLAGEIEDFKRALARLDKPEPPDA